MTTSPRAGPFEGDRYERLDHGVAVVIADPAMRQGDPPYDGDGLTEFAGAIRRLRLLDHVDDDASAMVTAMTLVDFGQGPRGIASRILHLLTGDRTAHGIEVMPVLAGLAGVLALALDETSWPPGKSASTIPP